MWYGYVKCLGFRGCDEPQQLKWGDLILVEEGDISYLEWNERLTKTRQGSGSHTRPFLPKVFANKENPSKCLVEAYKLFRSKRPSEALHPDSPFFLQVRHPNIKEEDSVWFRCQKLGENTLSSLMKKMATALGWKGKYTNHSARSSALNQLMHAGVPPVMIAQQSGHAQVSSVMNYAVANEEQQAAMSHILQADQLPTSHLPIPYATAQPVYPPPCAQVKVIAHLPTLLQPHSKTTTPLPNLSHSQVQSSAELQLSQSQSHTMADGSVMSKSMSCVQSVLKQNDSFANLFSGAVFNGPVTINLPEMS
jgi:hypothetical protein